MFPESKVTEIYCMADDFHRLSLLKLLKRCKNSDLFDSLLYLM